MNKRKRKLQREIHKLVSSEGQAMQQCLDPAERRSICLGILEAVGSFLDSWSELEDQAGLNHEFLRQTLSNIVQVLGLGDPQLRHQLWDAVQSIGYSPECCTVLLNFLPATILPQTEKDDKEALILILNHVFDEDSRMVAPVLECLTNICRSGGIEARHVFQFAYEKLPKEHESRIHLVIKTLVEHITSEMNAKTVVEAVRTELRSVEETESPEEYIVPTLKVFIDMWNQGEAELFFEVYLNVLEGLANCRKTPAGEDRLVVVDMIVLLLTTGRSKCRHQVEHIMDRALCASYFKSEMLSLFLSDEVWDSTMETLVGNLLSLAITALLAPTRHKDANDMKVILGPIKEFVSSVFAAVGDDTEPSKCLVTAMLHLTDELLSDDTDSDANSNADVAAKDATGDGSNGVHIVCSEIFGILNNAAMQIPKTLARFRDRIVEKLTSTRSSRRYSDATLCHLCALICNLEFEGMATGHVFETMHSTVALQQLLFSPPSIFPSNPQHDINRIRHGFLLASEMLSHSRIRSSLSAHATWSMLKTILLPSDNNMINHLIGLQGLKVARAISTGRSADALIISDIFQTITHMLSNARLIQYVSGYNERQRMHVAQAYTKPEAYFKSTTVNQNSRMMMFCFDAFLRDPALVAPSSWKKVNQWVFELIDTYLEIGRRQGISRGKRRWTPRPWIDAAIELQVLDTSTFKIRNSRQRRFFDFLHREMSRSDVTSSGNFPSDLRQKVIYDLTKALGNDRDLDEIIRSMFRLTLSLIISLAMSAAILNNTYGHYKDIIQDRESAENSGRDACTMIHYQLAKLYDLRRRCNLVEKVLRLMGSLKRKFKKRPGKRTKKRVVDDEPSKQSLELLPSLQSLRSILSAYFSQSNYIRSEILWEVAVDSIHDSTLVEVVEQIQTGSISSVDTNGLSLRCIVAMKSNILEHLSAQTSLLTKGIAAGFSNDETEYLVELRPKLARSLRLCSHLSLRIPDLREAIKERGSKEAVETIEDAIAASTVESLSELTSGYFRLLSNVTILMLALQVNSKDQDFMTLSNFLNLYISILGAEKPLGEGIDFDREQGSSSLSSFQPLQAAFQPHLDICLDASIASELLETLSILAIQLGDDAIAAMVDITWHSLQQEHPDFEAAGILPPPYPFRAATQHFMPIPSEVAPENDKTERMIYNAITRMGRTKAGSGKNFFLAHGMLRHWGLLALSPRCFSSFDVHLRRFLSNVHSFLSEVQDPVARIDAPSRQIESSDGDDEYLPPQSRRELTITMPTTCKIRGLNASSFSTYFDTLLQMTVATTSIFSISRESTPVDVDHPFERFESFVAIFGSLIKLCEEKLHIFPSNALPAILNSSKHMLNAVSYQVKRCIEWRNSQPVILVHEIHAGKDDSASAQYLEDLVDSVGNNVVGRVHSFCASVRTVTTATSHAEQQSGLKSLGKRNDAFKAELLKIAAAHNISQPRFNLESQVTKTNHSRKRQRTDHVSQMENLPSRPDGPCPDDEEIIPVNNSFSMDLDQQLDWSEPSFNDDDGDSASDTSYSFGASGQWGKDTDDETESRSEIKLRSTWVRPI